MSKVIIECNLKFSQTMETSPRAISSNRTLRAFVGCRTTRERNARGQGIALFTVSGKGVWQYEKTFDAGPNPSYLLVGTGGRTLYCVHGDGSTVSSFQCDGKGELLPLNIQSTRGTNPVHLALSPNGRWCTIANYASGDIAALPVLADGSLGLVACNLSLPAHHGPHRSQQLGAHPHQVVFEPSGRWLVVPDKGGDALHTVELDEDSGALRLIATLPTASGSGPRHLVFDPAGRRAWMTLELSSQILSMHFDPPSGAFTATQRVSSVPDSFTGDNTAAGITISHDGQAVLASNRGHGSVVRFAIEPGDGSLHSPVWTGTRGATPRFITTMPETSDVLVANEDADTILRIDASTFRAQAEPLAHTGSPVCIAFNEGTP